ncbi:MAG: hypothetical protein COA90_02215 [Gammaproteobacteria bacterium]|nr:MAG: hypothetical protein COA90_02215 [Gammaproteobacteria bacterium]
MIDNGLTILLLFGLAWFWWDSRGAAEIAISAAKDSCKRIEVTFLNDTVGWKKLRIKRNRQGRLQFQRTYFFEFASDMQQRYQGEVVMLGQVVNKINLDVYRVS